MRNELFNLSRKVNHYKEVLANTRAYRTEWNEGLRQEIVDFLTKTSNDVELGATIEIRDDIENLEAVVFDLGEVKSGMFQEVSSSIKRHMIKHNGSLIYQQLFNGKIIVLIQYPYIENYGQPKPPKTVAIYRPEEISEPFLIRHMEEFIQEVTDWEDYDDDEPNKKIGFELNFNPTPEKE